MMPLMDGPALIQILRKMNPTLPIIAATGLAASEQVARVARQGVKHFLSKPYTATILLQALQEALAQAVVLSG